MDPDLNALEPLLATLPPGPDKVTVVGEYKVRRDGGNDFLVLRVGDPRDQYFRIKTDAGGRIKHVLAMVPRPDLANYNSPE
jgi:hypothetical protein